MNVCVLVARARVHVCVCVFVCDIYAYVRLWDVVYTYGPYGSAMWVWP